MGRFDVFDHSVPTRYLFFAEFPQKCLLFHPPLGIRKNIHPCHQGLLEQIKTSGDKSLRINLARYVNRSAISIPETFSLQRTYTMFRVMGLRHLTIVNTDNRVTGIVTRRDLQNSNLMSRLAEAKSNGNQI